MDVMHMMYHDYGSCAQTYSPLCSARSGVSSILVASQVRMRSTSPEFVRKRRWKAIYILYQQRSQYHAHGTFWSRQRAQRTSQCVSRVHRAPWPDTSSTPRMTNIKDTESSVEESTRP